MDVSLIAAWLVCGCGAAVFAALRPISATALVLCAGAIVGGAWWVQQPFAPPLPLIGISAAAAAAVCLARPPRRGWTFALAGLLAGLATGALLADGLPLPGAVVLAAAIPAAAATLRARGAAFAPPVLRDDALLFVLALGLGAAAAPAIAEGWRAAGTLKLQGTAAAPAATAAQPVWTWLVTSAALGLGGFFSLWSRR